MVSLFRLLIIFYCLVYESFPHQTQSLGLSRFIFDDRGLVQLVRDWIFATTFANDTGLGDFADRDVGRLRRRRRTQLGD